MSMKLMLQFFVCSACPCALGSCSVAWCQIPGFINACCVRTEAAVAESKPAEYRTQIIITSQTTNRITCNYSFIRSKKEI